jgi:signal transduction histidine kinase
MAMSYLESSDAKLTSPFESNGGENRQENLQPDTVQTESRSGPEADLHISFALAHQLNNDLTVVQGHADRLFAKHQEDPALSPGLKSISEAAHRAARLIRNSYKFDSTPPTV